MNYLSHFFFDASNSNSAYILGIALPDLVKNHNRRWNLHPHKHEDLWKNSEVLSSINFGWQRHLAVDDLFHSSDYFMKYSRKISEDIRNLKLDNVHLKPFMVGHIGLELILDTLLIKNKIVDAQVFYNHLEACQVDDIEQFIQLNGIANAAEFRTFYQRFKDVQYLLSYKSNESIVYALNRIQYRLSGSFLNEKDTIILQDAIAECMNYIELDYLTVFEEIEWRLKN